MLKVSISSGQDQPADQCALFMMYLAADSRFAVGSDFESARRPVSNPIGRMTAAAVTGPAKGPRPASSIPQIFSIG